MRKDTITGRSFAGEFLAAYRLRGDSAADRVIGTIAADGGHKAIGPLMRYLTDYEDFALDSQPFPVQEFINGQCRFPDFKDSNQFDAGIAFFWKHYQLISLLLGTYSLPYCYAGANGAQVLWISERIKNHTFQRLEETGAFVFGIMQEKHWHDGLNLRRVAKIRLLHAAIRWLTNASGQWNDAWGYPICQEDMAATNLSFSYIAIRGLRKLNVAVSQEEEEAYLHFWNVIGSLLGIEKPLIPINMLEAYRLEKGISERQFEPSEAGRGLTKALLKTIEQQITSPTLQNFPAAQMRFFLGEDIANLLEVPKVAWEERFLKVALTTPVIPQLLSMQRPVSPVLQRYAR